MRSLESLNDIFKPLNKNDNNHDDDYCFNFSDSMSIESFIINTKNDFDINIKTIESEEEYNSLQYMFKMQKAELYSLENYYNNFRFVYSEEGIADVLKKAFEFLKTIIRKLILHIMTFLKMLSIKILLNKEVSRHSFYLRFDESAFTQNEEIKAIRLKNGNELYTSDFHRKLIDEFIDKNIDIENAVFTIPKAIEKRINERIFLTGKVETISCLDYIKQGFGSGKQAAKLLTDHFYENLKLSYTYVSENLESLKTMLNEMERYKDQLTQEIIDHYQNDKTYIQKLFYANHYTILTMIRVRRTVADALFKGTAGQLLQKIKIDDEERARIKKAYSNTSSLGIVYPFKYEKFITGNIFNLDRNRIEFLKQEFYLADSAGTYQTAFNEEAQIGNNVYQNYTQYIFVVPRTEVQKINELKDLIKYVYVENSETVLRLSMLDHTKMMRNFTGFDKKMSNNKEHLNRLDKLFDFLGLSPTPNYYKTNVTIQVMIDIQSVYGIDLSKYCVFTILLNADLTKIKLSGEKDVTLYHTAKVPNITSLNSSYRPGGLRNSIYTKGKIFFGINSILDRTISDILATKTGFKEFAVHIYRAADLKTIDKSRIIVPDPESGRGTPDPRVAVVLGDDPIPVVDITDAVYAFMLERDKLI